MPPMRAGVHRRRSRLDILVHWAQLLLPSLPSPAPLAIYFTGFRNPSTLIMSGPVLTGTTRWMTVAELFDAFSTIFIAFSRSRESDQVSRPVSGGHVKSSTRHTIMIVDCVTMRYKPSTVNHHTYGLSRHEQIPSLQQMFAILGSLILPRTITTMLDIKNCPQQLLEPDRVDYPTRQGLSFISSMEEEAEEAEEAEEEKRLLLKMKKKIS
ncbi:hypothetical protein LZ32DRAFT_197609 [Colletotrichum eremochloae]|nr:hypothetical protein LZ32DRAFT_197609 [Colletotrichum eremochloae]